MYNLIEIDSFLKKRDLIIKDLNNIEANWHSFFDNINMLSLEELQSYFKADDFYIEGALCIKINDVKLLSFRTWDLIDQLWSYFLNALYKLILEEEKDIEFYFPDQAIKVQISKIYNDNIVLKVGNTKQVVALSSFMPVFLKGAESFFLSISAVIGRSKYSTELDTIKALEILYL